MENEVWIKKVELKAKISHLITLLEVVPQGHPKYYEYSRQLDITILDLRDLMTPNEYKEDNINKHK